MPETTATLTLKRPINIKVIVTSQWKQDVQNQLQAQINQIDLQMEQLELQGQKAIAEIRKQGSTQANQQIDNVQIQMNQKKNEMLQQKNQLLQQMQQVQLLEIDQEVIQGQMEGLFQLKKGDNLIQKLNVEIVIRDGIVEEIRGNI